jgi:hypothetical protein
MFNQNTNTPSPTDSVADLRRKADIIRVNMVSNFNEDLFRSLFILTIVLLHVNLRITIA